MSKILVVEPHRMLQQAIALALFPEHEVKIVSAIPESSALKDFDAVIFDLKSLGESAGGAEAAVRAVQSWKVTTVWVQGSSHEPTPQRENLIPINMPIEKEVLLSAVAECLGTISKEKRLDPSTRSPAKAGARVEGPLAAASPWLSLALEEPAALSSRFSFEIVPKHSAKADSKISFSIGVFMQIRFSRCGVGS